MRYVSVFWLMFMVVALSGCVNGRLIGTSSEPYMPGVTPAAQQSAYAYPYPGYAVAQQPSRGIFSGAKRRLRGIFLGNERSSFRTWFGERTTPRPLKPQLFGTPNAINQTGEEQDVNEARYELRTGTRRMRMKERAERARARKDYAQNLGQYRSQYDIPKSRNSPYGQGFSDGCKTFMSAVGSGVWRLLDHKRMDAQRYIEDNWYLRGYNDGADFCSSRTDWDMH